MTNWLPAARHSLHHALTHPLVRLGSCVLAGAVFVLAGVAVHRWLAAQEVMALQTQLEAQHREIAAMARTRALHNAYHAAIQRLAEHDRRRPPPPSLAERLSQAQLVQAIAQLAHRSGLTLINEAYDPLTDRGQVGWRISLAAQADYAAVRAFVDGLSALAVPVHAERVRIDTTRDGERALKVQMLLRAPVAGESPTATRSMQ